MTTSRGPSSRLKLGRQDFSMRWKLSLFLLCFFEHFPIGKNGVVGSYYNVNQNETNDSLTKIRSNDTNGFDFRSTWNLPFNIPTYVMGLSLSA